MSLINNTTYTGKDSLDFFTNVLLTGNSVSYFNQMLNVKSIEKIPFVNISNLFQAESCESAEFGSVTLDQKSISVCGIDINLSLCNTDYESIFLSETLKPGSNYTQTPEDFAKFVTKIAADKISAQSEYMTWQGSTTASPPDICDGLLKKFVADANVIKVTGTTLSKSNIIAELEKVYNAIPIALRNQGDMKGISKVKIFLSVAAAGFYMQALYGTFPALVTTNSGDFTLRYLNVELIIAPGMPTNSMVAAIPDENLIFATDLVSDLEVKIEQNPKPGSKKTHWITSFKWGVNYAKSAEVVLYQ